MEPASQVILRPPPHLIQVGTSDVSVPSETISLRFFHEWEGFEQEVLEACGTLDLSQLVPLTDDMSENFVVSSKVGLTGRFHKHICDPVSKALAVTPLSNLKFGDYQAACGYQAANTSKVPDVTMLTFPDAHAIAISELKSFWTGKLEKYSIHKSCMRLIPIQPHLAQLILYMRMNLLKFGFLSTYKTTVFIRRTDAFRFDISLPIDERSTNPTLQQCFLAFSVFASNDPEFTEPPGFSGELLRIPTRPCAQASTRPSPLQNQVTQGGTSEIIGSSSILFGGEDGVAFSLVNCKRLIRGSKAKAIYEVIWDGKPAIAKCWSQPLYERYSDEATAYENLHAQQPEGFRFFPHLLSHGKICCPSIFPHGYILVMSKVTDPLNRQWDLLSSNIKKYIRAEMYNAVKILRSISVISVDCGQHNVLYSPDTNSVTMIDFELMQACEEDTMSPDDPEMYAMFEDED